MLKVVKLIKPVIDCKQIDLQSLLSKNQQQKVNEIGRQQLEEEDFELVHDNVLSQGAVWVPEDGNLSFG